MEITIIFLLILLNGIFSMSEMAIISARKSKLQSDAKKGNQGAKTALDTANHPTKFLATVQIGITLIGILTGIFSGEKITGQLTEILEQYSWVGDYAGTLSVVIVVICLTYMSIVFGEILPKRIGLLKPEKISEAVAIPMSFLTKISSPFVWLLTVTSDFFIKLFRLKPNENKVTEEEIKAIIQEGTEGGEVEEIEQDIMERVFSLGDRKVSSLMTHRNEIVYLTLSDSFQDIKTKVDDEMHSIYPVIKDDKDKLEGVVYLKDIVRSLFDNKLHISQLMREPFYMTENMTAYEALIKFKEDRQQSAVIVDEYGQMQGILTLNDLLEALVGNVDEYHEDEYDFKEVSENTWIVAGQYPFHEFLMKFDMEEYAQDYDYNTISGLILNELKDIPEKGEMVQWKEFVFEILSMDGARIDQVRLKKL